MVIINSILDPILETLPKQKTKSKKHEKEALKKKIDNKSLNFRYQHMHKFNVTG